LITLFPAGFLLGLMNMSGKWLEKFWGF